jgi:thiosulfate dehydrogenase
MSRWIAVAAALTLFSLSEQHVCANLANKPVQIKHLSAKELGLHLLDHKYTVRLPDGKKLGFDLVDPEVAPEDIHAEVMYGYRLLIETQTYAADFIKAKINCTNCHFCGGNTLGGRNGAISLVGVPSVYPRYSARDKKVITLEDRIGNCFMRSMNGTPPAKDSKEMKAIITYLHYISKEVASLKSIPWLGLQIVKSSHQPDAKAGAVIYTNHCAACHHSDGGGAKGIPPVWGKDSFNNGAGMNNLPMISAFVYWNMPLHEPILTIEEAMDVAAYIVSRPRPTFVKPEAATKPEAADAKEKEAPKASP